MIVAPSPPVSRQQTSLTGLVCPTCHSDLEPVTGGLNCGFCGRIYPILSGIADLRLEPDRYLSLSDDRAKARHLALIASTSDFRSLCRSYYAITSDVDCQQASRFLAHLEHAVTRAEAFVDFLPRIGRVLEVGCGSGGMLAAASKQGIAIEGVDIAFRWLVAARARLGSKQNQVYAANGERLPWSDASFSCVFADSVLEHLDDPPAALREWYRVTKPGAALVLVSPNRFSLVRDPHVGLWGVGFLPRACQTRYVRFRKKRDWPLRLVSAREAAELVTDAGWSVQTIGPSPAPVSESTKGITVALYEATRRNSWTQGLLKQFGPLWMLTATRGAGT